MPERERPSSPLSLIDDEEFDNPDTYKLVDEATDSDILNPPRFGVLQPSQLPHRNGKRASKKRQYSELEQIALRPVPRKPPTRSDKLVHHGRHYCRTIYAFSNVHGVITHGLTVENSGKRPDTQQQRRAHRVYLKLLNLVPGLSDRLANADDEDLNTIARHLQKGANQARSDDTKGLRTVIIDWLAPPDEPLQPSLSRTVKVDRGFNHDRTGELLCPPHINWSNPKIREQLRNKSLVVSGSDLPSFLWEDGMYDGKDIWKGFFRNPILVKAYKHIFTSPSSVDDAPKATRSGNARIHGMTAATAPSLAYVAVQVRFALSSETTFVRSEGESESEKFYETLLDIFEDVHAQHKVVEVLSWYNQQVFPAFTNSKRIVSEDSPYALFKAYSQSVKDAKAQKKNPKPSNLNRARRQQPVASSSRVLLDTVQEEEEMEGEGGGDGDEGDEENREPAQQTRFKRQKRPHPDNGAVATPKRTSEAVPTAIFTGRITRSAARQALGPGLSF
ncbi:hypothetical protein CC1G_13139 [Coprinopsis cinerea okayama7|uniref:Uncharacterized protein n=1 Tax=Coprinopsis cinerea (strain Okayama-7 / 130 / ATCC MYA-4618 / FGSC 9003) TaxID=240176 RepID=A8P0Y9_COPC7|nr:hypothetical protein CC1G_13139 [Coprinopsis cinerea okayama7\|eukprot:XP_001837996.1 hypothetical protein CC1G_13139 [Coprinopsis cinerea okayama7\